MKINAADRAFWSIIALTAGVGAGAWAVLCCGLWALVRQVVVHGWSGLAKPSLAPALVLVAFLAVSLAAATWSAASQVRATRALARHLGAHRVVCTPELAEAARSAGLSERVALVDLSEPFSCTYGVLRPRVAVSRGLVDSVTGDELAAVLAHEAHHVRTADPAKVMVARTARRALFTLPALGDLQERYLVARELAADRRAVRKVGSSQLAGALSKAVAGPGELELGAAAALGGDRALEARITQLETGTEPSLGPIDRRALTLTGVGALAIGGGMAAAMVGLSPLIARICHCSL